MSDADQIAAARGLLATADRWLVSFEHQLEQVRQQNEQCVREAAGHAAELERHKQHLAELDAAHAAKLAKRERELQNRENQLVAYGREIAEREQRAEATMRAAEARSADLSNRLHGVPA